ncbi:MAG: hypothetical protein GF350_05490 [Chitinivibrionales bacterium]|nr:hypothetical protein [Chitinivibrionales bacterium]
MKHKKTQKCFTSTAAYIGLLVCSCGIFAPRQDEKPLDILKRDPLNFTAVLDGTGEQFNKDNFEDMLHDNFTYRSVVGETFSKTQMVVHIEKIIEKYGTAVGVQWSDDPDYQVRPVFNENEIVNVYREYSFSISDTATDSSLSFSGSAQFKFAFFQQINSWTILEWYDIPSRDVSFFNPNSSY